MVAILGAMSPGPDFFMIARNSLAYSRRTGIFSALGLGLGILVHVAYSLIGIGLIISKSIILFSTIKFIGAGYLIFLGIKSLRSKSKLVPEEHLEKKREDLSVFAALRIGFLTNVLNPKATLFFLALFTQVIHSTTPLPIQIIYGLDTAVVVSAWFMFVAIVFTHSFIRQKISGVQKYIEKALGVVLIALGIKVALSSSK